MIEEEARNVLGEIIVPLFHKPDDRFFPRTDVAIPGLRISANTQCVLK